MAMWKIAMACWCPVTHAPSTSVSRKFSTIWVALCCRMLSMVTIARFSPTDKLALENPTVLSATPPTGASCFDYSNHCCQLFTTDLNLCAKNNNQEQIRRILATDSSFCRFSKLFCALCCICYVMGYWK